MKLLISIVTYNSLSTIVRCIQHAVSAAQNLEYVIHVFDNNSQDDTLDKIRNAFPGVQITECGENHGYAFGVNQCAKNCEWDLMLVLNPDVYMNDDSITAGMEFIRNNREIGLLGAKVINSDGESVHSHGDLPTPESFVSDFSILKKLIQTGHSKSYLSVQTEQSPFDAGFVTGAFVFIPHDVWDAVSGMDESFFLYFEDVDLAYRIRKTGRNVVVHPGIIVEHESGASFGKSTESEKYKLKCWFKSAYMYFKKHYGDEASKNALYSMMKLARSKLALLKVAGKFHSDSANRQRMIIEIHEEIQREKLQDS